MFKSFECVPVSIQLEGADSRKRSVEAGLIETVLKLVDSQEPVQVQYVVALFGT